LSKTRLAERSYAGLNLGRTALSQLIDDNVERLARIAGVRLVEDIPRWRLNPVPVDRARIGAESGPSSPRRIPNAGFAATRAEACR
jgi:hypothetical protein